MIPDISTIVIATVAFAAAFLVSRLVARHLRSRKGMQAQALAHKQESRQVRRARQRKKSG